MAKFQGNVLSLSKNIAKCFRGYFFDSHCNSRLRGASETAFHTVTHSLTQSRRRQLRTVSVTQGWEK